jgi:hypothetical protein
MKGDFFDLDAVESEAQRMPFPYVRDGGYFLGSLSRLSVQHHDQSIITCKMGGLRCYQQTECSYIEAQRIVALMHSISPHAVYL